MERRRISIDATSITQRICTTPRIISECVKCSGCRVPTSTLYHPPVHRRVQQIFGCEFRFSICFSSFSASAPYGATTWAQRYARTQQVPIWCTIEGIERCQSVVSMVALVSTMRQSREMDRRCRLTFSFSALGPGMNS